MSAEPTTWSGKDWVTVEEALALGVPEEVITAAQIEADILLLGRSYTDATGKRIDPDSVLEP